MFVKAFDLLPDAVFLFEADRRLAGANAAAQQLANCKLLEGTPCCEMFWHVEGADGCVVDRSMQTCEKVEVEILAGVEGNNSISIIVEPLSSEDDVKPGALVIARDISDLRRAEAEAIAHKSFIASIADRTPDQIYALDTEGRITWMNERAEADRLLMSIGGSFLEVVSED
jgi:PAS domain-containing protein